MLTMPEAALRALWRLASPLPRPGPRWSSVATGVRARLSAPFIEVSSGSVAVVERGHDGLRGHQIEMPAARVLEESDVVGAEPSRHPAADQVVEIAPHVLPPDRAARDRRQDVADPVEGGL